MAKPIFFMLWAGIILFAFSIIGIKNYTYGQTAQINNDVRIVAFGDSLVVGVGSTSGNDFVSVLSRRIGVPIINAGVSGMTTAEAIANLDSKVISLDPDIVILVLGGNDILQGVPRTQMINNLRTIIQRIQNSGAKVILVGVHGQIFETSQELLFANLASETGVSYVPNVLDGILGNPLNLSTSLHPNDRGYQIIADRIFPALQSTINSLPNQNLTATCSANKTSVFTNENVSWTAFATGGASNYKYEWSGSDNLSGQTSVSNIDYQTPGVKNAFVKVTSGESSVTVACSNTITVTEEPLVGGCSVSANSTQDGYRVRFSSSVPSRATSTQFIWTGTDGLSGNTRSITKEYNTPGQKTANLTIRSGNQTLSLVCSVLIDNQLVSTTERWRGGCSSSSSGLNVTWRAVGITSSNQYSWSGTDNLFASTTNFRKTYSTPGIKSATVNISTPEGNGQFTCQRSITDTETNGCFIATAAFGTDLDPHVATLRDFRDEKLLTTKLGVEFVETYYEYSPPIANYIEEKESLKFLVRMGLRPIIFAVENFL